MPNSSADRPPHSEPDMPVLHLTEADVESLVDMPVAIAAVERAFEQLAAGQAVNVPRARARGPGLLLQWMPARNGGCPRVPWSTLNNSMIDE